MRKKKQTLAKASESAIQKAVIAHMRLRALPGVWWTHINNNSSTVIAGKRMKASGIQAGTPDLLFVRDGRAFFVELKTERGRVSPVQSAMHKELTRCGCAVTTAYGLDQALYVLEDWGLIRARRGIV